MTHTLGHWVSGSDWDGASERTAPVYNPARGAVTKHVRLASAADVDAAVAATAAADRCGSGRPTRIGAAVLRVASRPATSVDAPAAASCCWA